MDLQQSHPTVGPKTNQLWAQDSEKTDMQVQSSVLCAAKPLSPPVRVGAKSLFNTTTANDPSSMATAGPKWAQKTITLPPLSRGCHLITPKVLVPNLVLLWFFDCRFCHLELDSAILHAPGLPTFTILFSDTLYF